MLDAIADLQSVRGHSYEAHTTNGASDPVAEVTNKILNLERCIRNSEKKTRPVERLQADLTGDNLNYAQMGEILRRKYIEHEPTDTVKRELSISGSTYWRRTRELLRLAKKYFGEEE